MRFGVNYTPAQGWFHAWLDLDPALVSADMAAIAALGADHVRIFPLWPLLQPNRTLIRTRAIDDLLTVVDLAGQAGLTVTVDALQGHLSSFDFLPSWVSTWHRRNLFSDAAALQAQANLVATIARELSSRPHADGLSLGNEFIQFAAPRHPQTCTISSAEAQTWLQTLFAAARQQWTHGQLSYSFDDDLWFCPAHPFLPAHAAQYGDVTTVHAWVFMQVGPLYGADHRALTWFARYLVELARAWGRADRPIWLQEVGAPCTHISAAKAPDFVQQTIAHLTGLDGSAPAQNLQAITWWCSHDVSPDLADFPALEYSLGLLANDGQVKPTGQAFQAAIQAVRQQEARLETPPAPARERPTLTLPSALPQMRAQSAPGSALFRQWMDLALQGQPAALQLPES